MSDTVLPQLSPLSRKMESYEKIYSLGIDLHHLLYSSKHRGKRPTVTKGLYRDDHQFVQNLQMKQAVNKTRV